MLKETQLNAYSELLNKNQKQKNVLVAIDQLDGATLFELVEFLGWPVNRITGRLKELVNKGLVIDSGFTKVNPKSRKSGIIWKLK